MNVIKYLILFLTALSSVVDSQERVLYKTITDNIPTLNTETEVYLGDRMLIQRKGSYRNCVTPKETYTVNKAGGWRYEFIGDKPLCKRDASDKDYYAIYDSVFNGKGEPYPMAIRLSDDKKGLFKLCWRAGGFNSACVKKIKKDELTVGVTFVFRPNSFQQTIEYAGKSGNIAKFLYSEFEDNFARQTFNREFQLDLSEGDVTAFKGAIIKVHDATNITVKYSVIRNFASE
jgi:hypothetical protein